MKFKHISNLKLAVKITIIIIFVVNSTLSAQKADEVQQSKSEFKLHEKGKYYITWGYNISRYEDSDIHFTGQGHDFILYDVNAVDKPSPLSLSYITPSEWSIPQFNFRAGYFLSDKYSISVGWDHMKYVAVNDQILRMYGYLDPSHVADPLMKKNMENMNAMYAPDGLYNDTQVQMVPIDFLSYEHTDGFNYASADMDRYDELWQHSKHNKLGITFVSGAGLGIIVPRTDAHLFGSGENHFWNIAGWGTNAKIGMQVNLMKHFYFESDLKCGYVQMLNVHTTNHYDIDKAQQNIVFYENNWLVGYRF